MPELPEVETIVRDLHPALTGQRIIGVQIWDRRLPRFPSEEDFRRRLLGRNIKNLQRRGKYIVAELDGGLTWLTHLRMTGRLLLALPEGERHQRAAFALDGGGDLWYCDLRRFGGMWVFWPGEEENLGGYGHLGPEPLSSEFSPAGLRAALAGRKAPIKALLLNQSIIAGLGNIYADEALFAAGIAPARPGGSLDPSECAVLVAAVREVLTEAIGSRGTTFRDYRSGLGTTGQYQGHLRVYGRAGQLCTACGAVLERQRWGGRTTVFCPNCQT